MTIDATRSGVAAQLAAYFKSNYEALLQAGAGVQPVTQQAPRAWLDATNANTGVSNQNSRFFLTQNGALIPYSASDTQKSGWKPPANAVEVDVNVAYNIENTGLSPTDWLMRRIADEFRINAANVSEGVSLLESPQPEITVDWSAIDTTSLQRLINLLLGAARDTKRDHLANNAQDLQGALRLSGLSLSNLAKAVELNAVFELGKGTMNSIGSLLSGQNNEARNNLTAQAVRGILSNAQANYTAVSAYIKTQEDGAKQYRDLLKVAISSLAGGLQSLADVAVKDFFDSGQFESNLDVDKGSNQQQLIQSVKNQLRAALNDPVVKENLVHGLLANAAALGLGNLSATQQEALLSEIGSTVIDALVNDNDYLNQIAIESVQFHQTIVELLNRQVQANDNRDLTPHNV